jgi:hypothetical protein
MGSGSRRRARVAMRHPAICLLGAAKSHIYTDAASIKRGGRAVRCCRAGFLDRRAPTPAENRSDERFSLALIVAGRELEKFPKEARPTYTSRPRQPAPPQLEGANTAKMRATTPRRCV